MLFDPARHEALCATPWSEAEVRTAIGVILDDVCRQFDPDTLWPVHPRERDEAGAARSQPMLYNGAAGVVWALHHLREKGAARVDLDLPAIASTLHVHSRATIAANDSEEASLLLGHSGVLLLQWKFDRSAATADALFALVEGNLRNPTRESLWGSPGTLVAALHMLEATAEPRWRELLRRGVDILWQQMQPVRHSAQPDREVWIWKQDLYGKASQYVGAGHGFAGNLFPVIRGAPVFEASNRVIAGLRAALGPTFPIIGVGGVMRPADAQAKIDAGADLVQIYTGFIYHGPELVGAAARALARQPAHAKRPTA